MKKEIHKISENKILKEYPIREETPGWYFRKKEIANNAAQTVYSITKEGKKIFKMYLEFLESIVLRREEQ